MGYLKYKGYTGSVEYSEDDKCLFGKVQGMAKDNITYEGATLHWRPADDPNSEWILYNSSDSLDLRKPLHLLVYANDAQSYRQYTLRSHLIR